MATVRAGAVGVLPRDRRCSRLPSPATIASYAKRKFGIEVQKDYARKRQAVYDDFDNGDYTRYELAPKHGVAIATVHRWHQ